MAPVEYKLPDVKTYSQLDTRAKLIVAQRYGWYEPPRAYREDVAQYVARFSKLPPGARREEVDRLTDVLGSKRAATQMARSAYREYQQHAAQGGDPNQRLVWIGEDDDATCDGCDAGEGSEGTAEEIAGATGGGPGHQECGGNCRCELLPIDPPQTDDWLVTGADAMRMLEALFLD